MEKLKAAIPVELKKMIAESTVDDLPSSSVSLHHFFLQLPLFHQMIEDLTSPELRLCGKNKEAALESKRRGNSCFSAGDYAQALSFYSQALRMAPMDVIDKGNNLVATLYVNRASSLHKIGLVAECLRDCDRALTICPKYSKPLFVAKLPVIEISKFYWLVKVVGLSTAVRFGLIGCLQISSLQMHNVEAWYRRARANTSLKIFDDAVQDMSFAMEMEQSFAGKKQIKTELELIMDQITDKDCVVAKHELRDEENLHVPDEQYKVKLQCVPSPTKGRGMASEDDIPEASLIHKEEPYAAIILKSCRETHCHFCLNELPADTVPCTSCSLPLYCSWKCQIQAGGSCSIKHLQDENALEGLPSDLEKHFSGISLADNAGANIEQFAEHRHECGGFHWSSVLPSDIVLAGRVLVKSMHLKDQTKNAFTVIDNLDLAHNYEQLPKESKLESSIYSIVLLYCLQMCYDSAYKLDGASISKVVLLISQIKVNSMAVVRVKSGEFCSFPSHPERGLSPADLPMSSVEQVRVGQAIYSTGSMINHSCEPNIHAYFLCRTLLIRSTECVVKGSPLELSYGPQVGQSDCGCRQRFLEEKYSFKCQCSGCSQLNLPDLVINSFKCTKPNCLGAILDYFGADYEKHKVDRLDADLTSCSLKSQLQADKLKDNGMNDVAYLAISRCHLPAKIEAGCCLTCGSCYDLKDLRKIAEEAEACIKVLQSSVASKRVTYAAILDTLPALGLLKTACHPYNKKIAEAEDILAEAYCFIGELKLAFDHCTESVMILKKLYNPKHIAVGNELVKLASVQLALGDPAAVDTISQLDAIFSSHYGSHADVMFPYIKRLKDGARSPENE